MLSFLNGFKASAGKKLDAATGWKSAMDGDSALIDLLEKVNNGDPYARNAVLALMASKKLTSSELALIHRSLEETPSHAHGIAC